MKNPRKSRRSTYVLAVLIVVPLLAYIASFAIDGGSRTIAPLPKPPATTTVALIKDNNRNVQQMVADAVTAVLGPGGMANLVSPGDTVLIHVNMTESPLDRPVGVRQCIVTSTAVAKAIVNLVQAAGAARTIIASGSGQNNANVNTTRVFQDSGYTVARFPGVEFHDFNDTTNNYTYTCTLQDGTTGRTVTVSSLYHDADVVINAPILKTHNEAGFTLALKNIFGMAPHPLVSGGSMFKSTLHDDIRTYIVDYNLPRRPDLNICDAIIAMEGNGPTGDGYNGLQGYPVTMNLIIAGTDMVAVDVVGCELAGIPPFRIPYIVLAANQNLGIMDLSRITITGNTSIAAERRTFMRAPDTYDNGDYQYRGTTVIRSTDGPISIDGTLSEAEWGRAWKMYAGETYQLWTGSGNWTGPQDCSFSAKMLYDMQNLYIAVSVSDTVKQNNANTGSNIRNGESVNFWLSNFYSGSLAQIPRGQFAANREDTAYTTREYNFGFSYVSAGTPANWIYSHNRALNNVQVAKTDTAWGYIMEIAIPWSNFNDGGTYISPATLLAFREFGFNMEVRDADAGAAVDTRLVWEIAWEDADTYEDGSSAIDWETDRSEMGVAYLDRWNRAPVSVPGSERTATAGQPVAFDGTGSYDADGTIVSYAWNFGDAGTGSGANPSHTYVAAGTYTVTLTVTDNKGATGSATTRVFVSGGGTPNQPPTVNLTSPVNGSTYTAPATVVLSAAASDSDGSIAAVRFYSGTTLLNTDSATPYSYNWTGVGAGSYALRAVATDNQGATSTSTAVNITVSNPPANQPPAVSLTSPVNGSTYTAPANITLTATATDSDGSIAAVRFYAGTTLLATDSTSPYSYTWAGVPAGSYILTVQAQDNQGAVGTSTAIGITVSAQAVYYTLTVNANPSNGGTITQSPTGSSHLAGTQVSLTAAPTAGYEFAGWSGDITGSSTTNPMTVVMDADKVLTANFRATATDVVLGEVRIAGGVDGYVNPAEGPAMISFNAPRSGRVTVNIFNPRGALVIEKAFDVEAGRSERYIWDCRTQDGSPAASGIYIVRISGAGLQVSRKIVIVR